MSGTITLGTTDGTTYREPASNIGLRRRPGAPRNGGAVHRRGARPLRETPHGPARTVGEQQVQGYGLLRGLVVGRLDRGPVAAGGLTLQIVVCDAHAQALPAAS